MEIENAYAIINTGKSTQTIFGINPIIISVIVTVVIFIIGIFVQYFTNRKREIKRLKSYKNTISILVDELKYNVDRQIKILTHFLDEIPKMTDFTGPKLKVLPDRKNILDVIDKKELLYLVDRWTVDSDKYLHSFLKLVRVTDFMSAELINMKDVYQLAFRDNLQKISIEWNISHEKYFVVAGSIPNRNGYFGISQKDSDLIMSSHRDYAIAHKELNVDIFFKTAIYPVLYNQELFLKAYGSDNPELKAFWNALSELEIVIEKLKNFKVSNNTFFSDCKIGFEMDSKALPEIKSDFDALKIRAWWKLG